MEAENVYRDLFIGQIFEGKKSSENNCLLCTITENGEEIRIKVILIKLFPIVLYGI